MILLAQRQCSVAEGLFPTAETEHLRLSPHTTLATLASPAADPLPASQATNQAPSIHRTVEKEFMDLGRSEAKITVAKLLELAYSRDKGLTAKILAQ